MKVFMVKEVGRVRLATTSEDRAHQLQTALRQQGVATQLEILTVNDGDESRQRWVRRYLHLADRGITVSGPTWRTTFALHKHWGFIDAARVEAVESGYPYFEWDGWVYRSDDRNAGKVDSRICLVSDLGQ